MNEVKEVENDLSDLGEELTSSMEEPSDSDDSEKS
jgi:hypothetical protein